LRFDGVDDVSGTSPVYLLALSLTDDGTNRTQFDLAGYGGHVHLDIAVNSVSKATIDLGPPPAQAAGWVPFSIDMELAATATGKLTTTLGSVNGGNVALASSSQQLATLVFGLQSAGNSATFQVSFDDATLEIVPDDGGLGITKDDGG